MRWFDVIAGAGAAFALIAAEAAAQNPGTAGRWWTKDNGAIVALEPCAASADATWGRIVWPRAAEDAAPPAPGR